MNEEFKQLIEDAASLIGYDVASTFAGDRFKYLYPVVFDPLDPERDDLMKVAQAAGLRVDYSCNEVSTGDKNYAFEFAKHNHNSLALAVLRAASAVWKSRGEE